MNGRILILGLAIVLAGCTSVPLMSFVALSRIDFATTDLEAMRVAIRLPEAIQPRPGGVKMDAVKKLGVGLEEKTTFLLVPARDSGDRMSSVNTEKPGFATHIYRLSDADLKRFEALRADLVRSKQDGKRGSLGLGIATTEFCRVRPVPEGPLPATTYLLTSETARYVVVTDDYDLRKDESLARDLAILEAC